MSMFKEKYGEQQRNDSGDSQTTDYTECFDRLRAARDLE